MTHYGALSGLVDGVERHLPHSVLAYYLQLVLTHEGLTIDQANALPDQDFAKLGGDVLWGVTRTAGGFPYERDCTLAPTLLLDPEKLLVVGPGPVTTEDVGLPFAASNFIARDLTPPPAPASSTHALALSRAGQGGPRAAYEACVNAIAANDWPEFNTALGIDDCETSGMAGKLAANTVRDKDMGLEAFRRGLGLDGAGDFRVFSAWTRADVDKASAFFTRLQGMFRSRALDVSLVIGLAGGAAANSQTTGATGADSADKGHQIDDMDGLGGHCFAVLRHVGADGGVYVRLLEGTSCVKIVRDPPGPPGYTVEMAPEGGPPSSAVRKQVPLSQFLSLLAGVVSEETRVVNQVIGGGMDPDARPVGILAGTKSIPGFIRPTLVMRCLHSFDPSNRAESEMSFYKWCMFTGLTSDTSDVGSLPLDSAEYAKCLGAGCRPAALASTQLKGVGINVPQQEFELPRAVLNEVWPPIATEDQFRGVLSLWAPLPSLSSTNADLSAYRQAGVSYATVACMETPASPALNKIIYRLKSELAALTNKINLARKDSDGLTLQAVEIATGTDLVIHVPIRPLTLTLMKSLREAKVQMGWAPLMAIGGKKPTRG